VFHTYVQFCATGAQRVIGSIRHEPIITVVAHVFHTCAIMSGGWFDSNGPSAMVVRHVRDMSTMLHRENAKGVRLYSNGVRTLD